MAGLSGLNLVYEAAGMHASLLGFCLESLIIDNDMLGSCLRCVRGIDTSDAALSIDTIAHVCLDGPGHYLGQEKAAGQTPDDCFYPAIGDRLSPKEWNDSGRPDRLQKAITEKKRILAERFPRHVTKAVDDRLRARFGDLIKLPRSAMGWRS
jgi:trimethylamine--corrinoid protein Co-methyltransferase